MKMSKLAYGVGALLLSCSLVSGAYASDSAKNSAAAAAKGAQAEVLNPIVDGVTNKEYKKGPVIKVASYNMGAARVSNIDEVTNAIKALGADIVALNEVDNKTERSGKVDQAQYIAKQLGLHYAFGRAIDFEGGQYGIAIVSKYPIENWEVVELPSGEPGVDEQRIVLAAEIKHDKFDSPIIVLNTHLDYKEDHSIQKQQVARINDIAVANVSLKQIKDATTKIKILMGDFNDTYNSANVAELERYWDLVSAKDSYKMRTWPAANPMADLDHIFTSRGQRWELKEIKVPGGDDLGVDWDSVSDHLPIIATMRLKER